MSNIVRAVVTIKGIRPLLIHHFSPEILGDGSGARKERSGSAGNNPEEWRLTMLATKDGQLYLEPTYVFATVRDGAKYTKRGRGSIQSALSATLQVLDDRILIDRYLPGYPNGEACDPKTTPTPERDSDAPVYLDVRSVKNPATKGRNVRYRIAASPGWSCSFTLLWDKTIVSRGEVEASVRDAGQLTGIADGRAIGFGRFELQSFEVTE